MSSWVHRSARRLPPSLDSIRDPTSEIILTTPQPDKTREVKSETLVGGSRPRGSLKFVSCVYLVVFDVDSRHSTVVERK
jgi:hypothetical protein